MVLSNSESSLFFSLMLPLQFFVNEKLGVLPEYKTFEKYVKASLQEKFQVRNALFDNIHLFDEFIDENPPDIPMKNLTIVSRWKKFIRKEFYIERFVKGYAIFIDADEDKVFAVYGLTDSLQTFFPKYVLPRLTNAVLLPFQDKIVTDGFFLPKNIYFGNGIKSELKEIYTKTKRKSEIIQTL